MTMTSVMMTAPTATGTSTMAVTAVAVMVVTMAAMTSTAMTSTATAMTLTALATRTLPSPLLPLHPLPRANGRQGTLERHLAAVPLVIRSAVAGHRQRLRPLRRPSAHEPRHRRRRRQRRLCIHRLRGHGGVGVGLRVEERLEVLRPRRHLDSARLLLLRFEIACERVVRPSFRILLVSEAQTAVSLPQRRRRLLREGCEGSRDCNALRLQVLHERGREGGVVRRE